jgi:tetratricopeptide (TPR) repeat protein
MNSAASREVKTMKKLVLAFGLLPALAFAQDAAEVRKMYEAGRYQQVVERSSEGAAPAVVYTAAQSHQKLGANDQARESYAQLAARPEDDAWHFIGLSGQQLLDGDTDGSVESARRAVAMSGGLAEAHFQLGLALAKREDWGGAADAFDRAVELNPSMAYGHYYGGLMHYRAGRPARMANAFEHFLQLAPEAPERPEVLQIMRTVRGR